MRFIKIGDTVINIGDIESIIESPLSELTIKVPRYRVIKNNDNEKLLYYHVENLKTGLTYYILKENAIKVIGWKDNLSEV